MKSTGYALLFLLGGLAGLHGQGQPTESATQKGFVFTPEINVEATSIKNQHKSGTCWSYATSSFLESEMIRAGRKPVDLSEMFTVRNQYIEKAKRYVRLHGALQYGQGGEPHDVIDLYRKYGAVPQSVYSGLHYGTRVNQFGELWAVLKGMLKAVVKNENSTLSTAWLKAFTGVLESYLGTFPKTFTYQGKTYTPKTFAREVVGLNPDDYLEFTSWADQPQWQPIVQYVPDNWSHTKLWNLPFEEMTKIVDHALRQGYTVDWGADVREPGFSKEKGIGYIPEEEISAFPDLVKLPPHAFDGPQKEPKINAQMRQEAYDRYQTTDDHAMQIVGLAKDQNGKEYYIVKNSWGTQRGRQGYWYVTKAYFRYKTTCFLLNRKALPKAIRKRIANYRPYAE